METNLGKQDPFLCKKIANRLRRTFEEYTVPSWSDYGLGAYVLSSSSVAVPAEPAITGAVSEGPFCKGRKAYKMNGVNKC